MSISAVVLCAGKAQRFAEDKLKLPLGGILVCQRAAQAFADVRQIDQIVVVAPKEDLGFYRALFASYTVVAGGDTRQQSVKAALAAVTGDQVLVHDGARPNVSKALIERVVDALAHHDAVVPTIPLTDSLVGPDGYCDRNLYRQVQTPQGFHTELLRRCLEGATKDYTDEGSLVAQSTAVYYVDGEVQNRKLTYPVDYLGLAGDVRTGIGYDIHRLGENRRLVLCGVDIPYPLGLVGHSDADCCLHAVMDAMLGAVGLPDIGHYFPNTAECKDADSKHLVSIIKAEIAQKNASVTDVSLYVVAEQPHLSPYIDQMRANLAEMLSIDPAHVGIGVTTNEAVPVRIDDLMTTQAIAAMAVVTVRIAH